jgi:regulation of enolase protein 1 (concanavalin A-like superfamily)
MLRIDAENWIKTGIEYVDGRQNASVVVTRGLSDWSVTPIEDAGQVSIEIERSGDTVTVRYGVDGDEPITMLRLAYYPPEVPTLAGVMCASPDGPGYSVAFDRLELTTG